MHLMCTQNIIARRLILRKHCEHNTVEQGGSKIKESKWFGLMFYNMFSTSHIQNVNHKCTFDVVSYYYTWCLENCYLGNFYLQRKQTKILCEEDEKYNLTYIVWSIF